MAKLNKRLSLFIVLILIAVVAAASITVLWKNSVQNSSPNPTASPSATQSPKNSPYSSPSSTPVLKNVLWQQNLEHFAADITVDGGKVFTTDVGTSAVNGFDEQTGSPLWNTSLGSYSWGSSKIEAHAGKVYDSSSDSVINCLDTTSGTVNWKIQAHVDSVLPEGSSFAEFAVVDNRLFATVGDGFVVYSAVTGEHLWEYPAYQSPYYLSAWAYEGNLVYASGTESVSYIYKLDPDNGSIIWKVPASFSGSPLIFPGEVVLQNYNGSQDIVSLNETSGDTLWSYNVGVSVYQPTVYESVLLFGTSSGKYVALNVKDGTLNWTTTLGSSGDEWTKPQIFNNQEFVDTPNYQVFLAFQNSTYCLNLKTGTNVWSTSNPNGESFDSFVINPSNRLMYAVAGSDLYTLNTSTGQLQRSQHFDHYVLPPIVADNKVFVAADLYLIAYG